MTPQEWYYLQSLGIRPQQMMGYQGTSGAGSSTPTPTPGNPNTVNAGPDLTFRPGGGPAGQQDPYNPNFPYGDPDIIPITAFVDPTLPRGGWPDETPVLPGTPVGEQPDYPRNPMTYVGPEHVPGAPGMPVGGGRQGPLYPPLNPPGFLDRLGTTINNFGNTLGNKLGNFGRDFLGSFPDNWGGWGKPMGYFPWSGPNAIGSPFGVGGGPGAFTSDRWMGGSADPFVGGAFSSPPGGSIGGPLGAGSHGNIGFYNQFVLDQMARAVGRGRQPWNYSTGGRLSGVLPVNQWGGAANMIAEQGITKPGGGAGIATGGSPGGLT